MIVVVAMIRMVCVSAIMAVAAGRHGSAMISLRRNCTITPMRVM